MATNKKTRDTVAVAAVIVACAAVIMANLLADRKFARLDLTGESKYSVSAPFGRIMDTLDDTATITYYISGTVPAWFESTKRDILDKLHEIETASKGKVVVEAVDPTDNKELVEQLRKDNFEHEVQDIKKDQFSVLRVFTGAKITYKSKPKADIPAIGAPEQVEYLLGSKILELTLAKKKVIAVDVPVAQQPPMMMGRQQQGSGFEWLQHGQWEGAKDKFEVKSVDLSESNSIPSDAVLLILVRPKELNERQRYEVIRYLAGGGRVMLIASPFKLSQEFGWRAEKTPTGLEDYLSVAGISFGAGIVADHCNVQMPMINMFTGEVNMARFPFYVKILESNIDQESVLTRYMPALLMPIPAEIKLDSETLMKNGLTARVLAKTSKQSWTVPFSESINPDKELKYNPETQAYTGSKNVFVMAEGEFPFPYEGKPVPEWKAASSDGDQDKDKDKDKDKKGTEMAKVERKPGVLVLCSAPEAFHSMYLSQRQMGNQMRANMEIIVNIAETFSLGDDLIKLRSKGYETRSIDTLAGKENDLKRNMIKAMLIFGMPVLVIIAALARTLMRRATQIRYERKLAETIGPSSFTR
ncbi:MAG: GldG family protein [Planctomycetota bacterium]|nr:GldG family protein [Planctomycetota bacterium]